MKSLHENLTTITQKLGLSCHFEAHHESLWCELSDKTLFFQLAEIFQTLNARVCMITAYTKDDAHELVYHFDIEGIMINVTLRILDSCVLSITPLFKSADWTERELSELYGIQLLNHPNPKRLFLDETIKENVLKEYYTLSSMMNGRVSESLWNAVKTHKETAHGN